MSAHISLKSEPSTAKTRVPVANLRLLRFQLFMTAYRPFSQLIYCQIYRRDSVAVGDHEQHNKPIVNIIVNIL